MSQALQTIEIETGSAPTFSVIWLHGLGADGNDFVPIVPELGLPASAALRFVFPHAPLIPVTCNNGYVMRAWYDIAFIDGIDRQIDAAGVALSCAAVRRLIGRENARGVPTRNIVLAGFSQGGAIAYTAGLTHPEPLAGIIALSAYIPSPGLLTAGPREANHATPIFAAHGRNDDVVPPELGLAARDALLQDGYLLTWRDYLMPHSVCAEEIDDVGDWLRARLAARDAG